MQEQIEREAIAIMVKSSKLTAKTLAALLNKVGRNIIKAHRESQAPHGKQSVKKLMNHNVPTNTITIEGDKGLFDKIARKWNVDYAFQKTGPDQYLLLFKSGQADTITAAFSEYSNAVVKRARDKRPSIMEELNNAARHTERTEREKPTHWEHRREREAARG